MCELICVIRELIKNDWTWRLEPVMKETVSNGITNAVKMSITLNTYLKEEVDNISQELKKSKSGIIADALEYYLDYIDLCLAEKRLNDGSKFISAEEIERLVDGMAD